MFSEKWANKVFWPQVTKTNTCWLWRGYTEKGYGRVGYRFDGVDRLYRVHRVSYSLLVGPLSEELTIDHLCRVKHCVNPGHLEPVTVAVNSARAKSHLAVCKSGHKFSGYNLIIRSDGSRRCRECNNARYRAYKLRQRAAS